MLNSIGNYIRYCKTKIIHLFNYHPKNVCMSYLGHMQFALKISLLSCYCSMSSLIHAFFPFLFITTASDINLFIANLLKDSGCRD